jgi:hypothetical protein
MSSKVPILVKPDWFPAMSDFQPVVSQFAQKMALAAKYLNM